jgi:hypothetical protein
MKLHWDTAHDQESCSFCKRLLSAGEEYAYDGKRDVLFCLRCEDSYSYSLGVRQGPDPLSFEFRDA